MIEIATNLLPIASGFLAQMTANKAQRESRERKFLLQALVEKNKSTQEARTFANKENNVGRWFRRTLVIIILMFFIMPYLLAPFFDIDLVLQTKQKTMYLFGLVELEYTKFKTISGLMKFDEIFNWATMILEFYFGSQFARKR